MLAVVTIAVTAPALADDAAAVRTLLRAGHVLDVKQ